MPQMPFFSSSLCTGNEIRQSVRNILESAMRTAVIPLLSKKGKYIFTKIWRISDILGLNYMQDQVELIGIS